MKMEGLIAGVGFVGYPARAGFDIFWVILEEFWPNQATCVAGEQFCEAGIPSCALMHLLRVV